MKKKALQLCSGYSALLLYTLLLISAVHLSACLQSARADGVINSTERKADTLFTGINKLPPGKRVAAANQYRTRLRKAAPATALQSLNRLEQTARQLNDPSLQCAVAELRADYYSVNQGFNAVSTKYYQQAIVLAKKYRLEQETAIYLQRLGLYYYTYRYNSLAASYFLQAQEGFRSYGLHRFPNVGVYLIQQANLYFSIEDWDNAASLLKSALQYDIPTGRYRIGAINSLGLICRNTGRYPEAMQYFKKAVEIAKAQRDSAWIIISTGNIGSLYFFQGNYKAALPLIELDYRGSLKYNEKHNAVIALLRLAEINLIRKNTATAAKQLDTAIACMPMPLLAGDTLRLKVDYYRLRSQLNEQTGNLAQALSYRKRYEQADALLNKRFSASAVERIELKHEFDKERLETKRFKAIASASTFKRNAIILIMFLIIVVVVLIYYQQTRESREKETRLKAEKDKIDAELASASEALMHNNWQLEEHHNMITHFREENNRLQSRQQNHEGVKQLAEMMQIHLMTEEKWADFRRLFSTVHPDFFHHVKQRFPHLTGTDIRLLVLTKLHASSHEMATMLGITAEGVKKARQRLRKKIDVQTEEQLNAVVASL